MFTDAEREEWSDRAGRTFQAGDMTIPRNKKDLARAAHELYQSS
ncbi:hypothetical protein U879_03325 [Defluviimonas sp. 20V17]|uniref:Uncharacterized protein n=1 Tax=Allgaiera indica TaxID=765699 RepID=A0AAN5A0Y0_9RHOB|nr:hypothetical protein [Allgaiera indica]KDB05083.1 hypothetical protein U879_03325 [Defluviimonas sp. 20V17]GHE04451.1 hypothetical protein GCM10008024_31640 [Allgaiera indica]